MDLPEELANRPPRKGGQQPTSTLTLDAYLRLRGELDELKISGRATIAERLKAAREHGDIRENAEYDAAKNEQALMESRIRNLERMLRDPEIVEGPAESEVVAAGMLVTLRPLEEDEPEDETYLLAESAEERAVGRPDDHDHVAARQGAPGGQPRGPDRVRGAGRDLPLPGRRVRAPDLRRRSCEPGAAPAGRR